MTHHFLGVHPLRWRKERPTYCRVATASPPCMEIVTPHPAASFATGTVVRLLP
jgi:hypothetical protein